VTEHDIGTFTETLRAIYAYYGKDLNDATIDIWWGGGRNLDIEALRDAFNRHVINPDTGQFLPRIADVVKMAEGSSGDTAARAWTLVDQAVRMVGPYRSVTFDDRLTMRVLHDMGGWIALCGKKEDEWPFVAKEFQTRYKAFRIRSEIPDCPPQLPGIAEHENGRSGQQVEPGMLIGNHVKALEIKQTAKLNYDQLARPVLQLARAE